MLERQDKLFYKLSWFREMLHLKARLICEKTQ